MPDSLQPITSSNAPRYRYYTVNIVTNKVIGEIPFEDVDFARSVKSPGEFNGKITINDQTKNLDLYNSTLPGKTALYVVRDGKAAWGGIIWGRTYDLVGRSLAVTASEFTSYLSHRLVWKTYSNSFTANIYKPSANVAARVVLQDRVLREPLPLTDGSGNLTKVQIGFSDTNLRKYNGFYTVVGKTSTPKASSNPGRSAFYVDMASLPPKDTGYDLVGVTIKVDTYHYLRDLIENTLNDFVSIEFPNEVITPGIKVPYRITTKQLTTTDSRHGTATLTTSSEHDIIVGQRVEIVNTDPMLDGLHVVTDVPTATSFKFEMANPLSRFDNISPIYLIDMPTTSVSATREAVYARAATESIAQGIKYVERVAGVVTLTFNGVHNFIKNDKIVLDIQKNDTTTMKAPHVTITNGKKVTKTEPTNTFDYQNLNNTVIVTSTTPTTLTYDDPTYTATKWNRKGTVSPTISTAKSAAPLAVMQLFVDNDATDNIVTSDGYAIGDDIKVYGVDQPGWGFPLYDGYYKVYDVDPGRSIPITHVAVRYEVLDFDDPDEDTDDEDKSYFAYIFTDTSPSIRLGDRIEISGIANKDELNGSYYAAGPSEKDSTLNKWFTRFEIFTSTAFGYTAVTSSPGMTASIGRTGSQWVAYRPNNSEIRNSLQKEPDAQSTIDGMSYSPKTKTKPNKVTVKTKDRHGLSAGDIVEIALTTKTDKVSDQEVYGGVVTVVSVLDLHKFTYTLINSEHKKTAPKTKMAFTSKSGTVTRKLHNLTMAYPLSREIQSIRTVPDDIGSSTAVVYSEGHAFEVGDTVAVSIDNPEFQAFDTVATPAEIIDVDVNTFRYKVGAQAVSGESSQINSILYSSNASTISFKVPYFGSYSAISKNIGSVTFNSPLDGYIEMTTTTNHGLIAGRRVTLSGFSSPGTSAKTSNIVTKTIGSLSYNSLKQSLVVRFTTAHGLNAIDDIGASLALGNFSTFDWPSQTSRFGGLNLTELNDSYIIKEIPTTESVVIDFLNSSNSWEVYGGLGSASAVITTETKTVLYENDLSMLNMTAEIVKVTALNKVVFKYPDTIASTLVGSQSVAATLTAPAQKGTTSEQVRAGDFISISGLANKNGADNKYTSLNRDGYKVKSVTLDAPNSINTITISNPKKDAKGKYVKYASTSTSSKFGGSAAKIYRGYETSGHAYIDSSGLSETAKSIVHLTRDIPNNEVTIDVGSHGFLVGEFVNILPYTRGLVALGQNARPIRINNVTATTITYEMYPAYKVEYVARSGKHETFFLKNPVSGRGHDFVIGDEFTVSMNGTTFDTFEHSGATQTVINTSPTSITVATSNTVSVKKTKAVGTITPGTRVAVDTPAEGQVYLTPSIYRQPTVYVRTYGEYPANANMGGISFVETNYSNEQMSNTPIHGSGLETVSTILEQYSNGLNGFDYRIDVNLSVTDTGEKVFSRVFTIIPIYPPSLTTYLKTLPGGKLAPGQVATPAALGADKVVFEYPGNIANVTLSERAESSATRIFVTGSNSNAGTGAESAYAAAADTDLLLDNWPILDKKEQVTWPSQSTATAKSAAKNVDDWGNHDDETDFHTSALRFLKESRPPAGDFSIEINGSVPPIIGSYDPGNWCSIIINDDFVKTRLDSVLEPRKDVLVRRIDTIKVSVPNNPAFPEKITLDLIADWQVDAIGK